MRRTARLFVGLVVAVAVGIGPFGSTCGRDRASGFSQDPKPSSIPSAEPTCGPLALCTLARLQGIDADIDEAARLLGSEGPSGHSLRQLIDAGPSLGLRLRGVRMSAEDWPSRGPAIAHLLREGKGHFVVIRPVGHSGLLVQVIDPPDQADVWDFQPWARSSGWTGATLVIEQSSRWGSSGWLAGLAIALAVAIGLLIVRRRRRARVVLGSSRFGLASESPPLLK